MSAKPSGIHSHTTVSGRVVYNRRPNPFRPSDVIRITGALYDAELPDIPAFAELYSQILSFNLIYGLRALNPQINNIDPFILTRSIYVFMTLVTDEKQLRTILDIAIKLLDTRPTIAKLIQIKDSI